jgi:hypothetical protein
VNNVKSLAFSYGLRARGCVLLDDNSFESEV